MKLKKLATSLAIGAALLSGQAFAELTIGFSQIGAESAWRTAETESVKEEAAKRGYTLKFSDAQQKQENQIKAIRSFIAQGVDGIAQLVTDDESNPWYQSRMDAYLDINKQRNIKPIVYEGHQSTFSSWVEEYETLSHWLHGLTKPCGVIVASDVRARTLVSVCEEQGIIIPDEISIVSIGDMKPLEFFHTTSISVIDPNYSRLGMMVCEQLHRLIENQPVEELVYCQPELVIEGTSTDFRAVVDPSVIRALHYMRKNYHKGIKVQHVVDSEGCSRTQLESKFKEHMGHSIHAEIYKLKLEHAVNLLTEQESLNIDEIAKQSGYPSTHYFYGLFKKRYGLTPTEFKQELEAKQ